MFLRLSAHLESNGVDEGQQYPERQPGLVGSVRPQSVGSGRHAHAGDHVQEGCCKHNAENLKLKNSL